MSRIAFLLLMALFAIVKCQSAENNSTTTTNSTTTEPTTNTTTAVPTTASPTTTSAPAPTLPPPIPEAKEWNGTVTKDNTTCIRVQFAVQIRIKYNNTINNTEVITTGFNIPIDATVDESNSFCSPNRSQNEKIVISFVDQEHTSANLTLRFNSTKDNAFVEDIELSYILTEQLFPFFDKSEYNKIVKVVSKTGLTLFSVPADHSYVCDKALTASLDNEDSSLKTSGAEVEFTNSKVEAYIEQSKDGKFDSEINCKSTEISDVVPIAVGAALAGLVLIVLIAYFIGRRRSRRLAYQSV